MVFEGRTPARIRADLDSRSYAAIPGRTVIGPVSQVHMLQFLDTHGSEIHSPSTTTPNRTSCVVICRRKNRYVDELHLRDPGHNATSSDLLLERTIARESEPCSTETVHRTSCRTHVHAHSRSGSVVRWSSITHLPRICAFSKNSSYFAQHVVHHT